MEWQMWLLFALLGNVVLDFSGLHPLRKRGEYAPLFLTVVLSTPLVVQMVLRTL